MGYTHWDIDFPKLPADATDEEIAERRAAMVRALGYDPAIEQRPWWKEIVWALGSLFLDRSAVRSAVSGDQSASIDPPARPDSRSE